MSAEQGTAASVGTRGAGSPEGAASVTRLVVPDVLRGIAILAMLIAHAGPFFPSLGGLVGFIHANINDLASPLFALVMGMSAQLTWNARGPVGRTIGQQFIRGAILIVLGVWLASWGTWVAIVLAYLGLLLIVGAPILLLRTRWLVLVTIVLALATQPLLMLARGAGWVYMQPRFVIEVSNWIALGNSYRLVNLLPFFLLGALLLRGGLARDRWMWIMLAVAPVAYAARLVAEGFFGVTGVRSGDYLDTLHDVGLVFSAYVVVVLLNTATSAGVARVWQAVALPFRAWGQLALSLYLFHVGFLALYWDLSQGRPTSDDWVGAAGVVVLSCLVGWIWWRFVGTGPVEWLLGFATGRRKPLRVQR